MAPRLRECAAHPKGDAERTTSAISFLFFFSLFHRYVRISAPRAPTPKPPGFAGTPGAFRLHRGPTLGPRCPFAPCRGEQIFGLENFSKLTTRASYWLKVFGIDLGSGVTSLGLGSPPR